MRLLESTGVSVQGLRAVVLGRSDIVGSPVAAMLRNKDATITQCHSKTTNLPEIVRLRFYLLVRSLTTLQVKEADILVAAIGKPEFVQGSWLKPGVVVVDVGTNYIPGALAYRQIPQILTARQIRRRNRGNVWLGMWISPPRHKLLPISHLSQAVLGQ